MRCLRWFGTVAALAIVVSCASDDAPADAPGACSVAEGDRAVSRSRDPSPPEDLLQWSGFADIGVLEVVGADEECGLDASARVALRGSATEIDAALAAAGFDDPPTQGLSILQPPLKGIDLAELTGVVSSDQQAWENTAGERLTRLYVRGRTGEEDQELLHIWAFTT